MIRLSELKFRACEGYYSKSAYACTWPCSITQMDDSDQLDRVYEALVHWADAIIVATPIRWGAASSLYFKMAERLNCVQNSITIRNQGSVPAQLISRHWVITDSQGLVQEVRGLGVVGAQPLLQPGESYEYTSGASIATPVGTMRGSYQMVAEDGTRFEAPIPQFTLSVPRVLH